VALPTEWNPFFSLMPNSGPRCVSPAGTLEKLPYDPDATRIAKLLRRTIRASRKAVSDEAFGQPTQSSKAPPQHEKIRSRLRNESSALETVSGS